MNNPLTKGKLARPVVDVIVTRRELTPAEARRVHVLHLRLDTKRKALAFVESKIAREIAALLKT